MRDRGIEKFLISPWRAPPWNKNNGLLGKQYTPEEYKTKVKWGHSPFDYTVKVALAAKVKTLVLFHHDPLHDDAFVDSMIEAAKKLSWQEGSNMNILGAQEGMELSLD